MRCWYLVLLLTRCRHLQAERQDLELDLDGEAGPTATTATTAKKFSENAILDRLAELEVSGDENEEVQKIWADHLSKDSDRHVASTKGQAHEDSDRHVASTKGQAHEELKAEVRELEQDNEELREKLQAAQDSDRHVASTKGQAHEDSDRHVASTKGQAHEDTKRALIQKDYKQALHPLTAISLAQLLVEAARSGSEEKEPEADALDRLPKVHYNKLNSLLAEGGAIERSLEATRTEAEQVTVKAEEWREQESNMMAAAEKMSKESEQAEKHLAAGVKNLQDDRVKIASQISKEEAEEKPESQNSSEPTKA